MEKEPHLGMCVDHKTWNIHLINLCVLKSKSGKINQNNWTVMKTCLVLWFNVLWNVYNGYCMWLHPSSYSSFLSTQQFPPKYTDCDLSFSLPTTAQASSCTSASLLSKRRMEHSIMERALAPVMFIFQSSSRHLSHHCCCCRWWPLYIARPVCVVRLLPSFFNLAFHKGIYTSLGPMLYVIRHPCLLAHTYTLSLKQAWWRRCR